jgi:large subunit ribosomal protein L21e
LQSNSIIVMPKSYGYRARTRSKFARAFRAHGPEHLSTYLRTYKVGDYVDIKANGAIHKGMPHSGYHGRTGVIWNVTPRAVGVIVNKQVRTRVIKKRIHVRTEHVKPSKCRQDFLDRVAKNDAARRAAKKGEKLRLRRSPVLPAPGHFVNTRGRGVETMTPIRYVLLV